MFTVCEDDHVRVTAREAADRAAAGDVLLSFTGVGHAMGGLDVQKPEFFGTARGFANVLFVTDKARTWGNALDLAGLAARLAPFTRGRRLCSIGNSMGGFLAVIAGRHFPLATAIAFAPQFSVNPRHVPWERRWAGYTDAIPAHVLSHAGDHMGPDTRYCLFSSGEGLDRRHARLFPVGPNIRHFLFPGFGHDVAARMKEEGILSAAVAASLEGSLTLDTLRGPGGIEVVQLSPA
jgi:dienelactone hydrolase